MSSPERQGGLRYIQMIMFGVVIIGTIYLVKLNLDRPTTKGDIDEIKNAVESGILLLGEACTTTNHDDLDQYKDSLAVFWGNDPVPGATLTVLWDLFNGMHPTASANSNGEKLDAASTEVALGNPEKATEIAGYVRPTPSWNPEWTLLQEVRNQVDQCQQYYGSPSDRQPLAYGLLPFNYHDITIAGNDADVEVRVNYWQDYSDNQGGVTRRSGQPIEYSFHLKKMGSQWKIVYQDYDTPTF